MLVSRYAGYGAYDTKSVSTYNNPDNASSIESALMHMQQGLMW